MYDCLGHVHSCSCSHARIIWRRCKFCITRPSRLQVSAYSTRCCKFSWTCTLLKLMCSVCHSIPFSIFTFLKARIVIFCPHVSKLRRNVEAGTVDGQCCRHARSSSKPDRIASQGLNPISCWLKRKATVRTSKTLKPKP